MQKQTLTFAKTFFLQTKKTNTTKFYEKPNNQVL